MMDATYTAWEIGRYGGPRVLSPVTRTVPLPKPEQVLIRIHASAATRADGMMRSGKPIFARPFLGWSKPRPCLVGTCFSGEVVDIGHDVRRFKVGDAVFGEAGMQFGANADYICLDASGALLIKPENVSHQDAATLCDGASTSWHFLTKQASVRPGQRVLVLGGSGSLGTAAIQIAKSLGADVAATGSPRNLGLLESLGATQALDYSTTDPLAAVGQYDAIFDTVGISSFAEAKPALTPEGVYMCPVLGFRLLLDMLFNRKAGGKRACFAAAGLQAPEAQREEIAEILKLMRDGRFSPVIDRVYPLSDLVEAHEYVETGHKRGNVVVV